MKSDVKSSGIKGALKVYKVVYDTDKLVVLLLFPAAILRAVKPYIALLATAYILDGFVSGRTYENLLYIALGAVALSFAVDFIESYITKIQQARKEVCIPRIYLTKAEKYLSIDYQLLESPAVNDINSRIARDNRWGSGFYNLSWYLKGLLDNVFGFVVGVAMMVPFFISNSISGGLALIVVLLIFAAAASVLNSKVIQAKLTELLNTDDPKYSMKHYIYFVYGGGSSMGNLLKTSRIYNLKNLLSGYLEEDQRRQEDFCKVLTKYASASGLVGALTSGIITVSAYLFIVARAVTGAVSVSNVVRYAGTIYNLANNFFGLSSALTTLIDQTDRIQGMLEFMEVQNVLYKGTLPIEKRKDNQYALEFHNVSFKYPGSDDYALRNFSIKLNIGQRLAIVGMNGSGKTTMIKLLCRLYDPSEGAITLNGIDIRKYDYTEYMQIFSVVFQDFKIFSFKLSENIACSTDVDADRAAKVIDMIGLSNRADRMTDGLDTYLYNDFDKGVEISGGEAQKIALARALYKNAPFIILDEPTAALDPIAVFHEGRLIQRGNHDALLLDRRGKYYEMWSAQAQYYDDKAIS